MSAPGRFAVRAIAVPPGGVRRYDPGEWRGALVLLERGELELEALDGTRRRLAAGAVLWLGGLPLRVLRASGREAAVLVAVTRRGVPVTAPPRSRSSRTPAGGSAPPGRRRVARRSPASRRGW